MLSNPLSIRKPIKIPSINKFKFSTTNVYTNNPASLTSNAI